MILINIDKFLRIMILIFVFNNIIKLSFKINKIRVSVQVLWHGQALVHLP